MNSKHQSIGNIFHSLPLFHIFSFLLILFILFIKNPYLYIYPAFIPDDLLLFMYHFNRPISENSFFYFYANYFLFLPNIFATLFVAILPLEWLPRAFALVSLVLSTTTNWLFCLRPFSIFVSSRLARLIICALITLQPIGSWPLQSALLWQCWNLTILIVLLILIEPFINDRKWLFIIPIIIVSIFSTPSCVIFLPLFLIKGIRHLYERKILRSFTYFILSACILFYAFWGLNNLGSFYGALRLHFYRIIRIGLLTGLPRVIFEGFSSLPFRMILHDIYPVLPFLFSVFIFIILCIVVKAASKKNPYIQELALFVGYVIISITVLSLTRWLLHDDMEFQVKGFRYFYVQKYAILLLFSICIYQLIVFLSTKIKLVLTLIAFVLVISFFASDNYRFCIADYSTYAEYKKKKANSEKIISLREEGIKLAECLSRAQQELTAMELTHRRESQISCKEYYTPFDMDLINNKE